MNSISLQHRFCASYEEQSDDIFRFCLARVSNRDEALDLTQETFTRLWVTLAGGTKIANTRAFLFTIANHLIIDWYRKKKPISLEEMMNGSHAREKENEPSDKKTYSDLQTECEGRCLTTKLKELGETYRVALQLRFVEGWTPSEIGKLLDISANAVSVRVNRGLKELRLLARYDLG